MKRSPRLKRSHPRSAWSAPPRAKGSATRSFIRRPANPATTDQIQDYAKTYASGLDVSQLTVTATFPADPRLVTKKDAQVVVTYNYPLNIPFISAVTLNLSSTSKMLVSQ